MGNKCYDCNLHNISGDFPNTRKKTKNNLLPQREKCIRNELSLQCQTVDDILRHVNAMPEMYACEKIFCVFRW